MITLEEQVALLAKQYQKTPADIRNELMKQMNLSPEEYAKLNPDIRSVSPDGKYFIGQPG